MKTIFSFEVFPPKKTMPIDTIYNTLDELKDLHPDFISVTFGAGGSENCDNAVGIAKRIKDVCNVKSVIHMPCLNMTKNELKLKSEENLTLNKKIQQKDNYITTLEKKLKDMKKTNEKELNQLKDELNNINRENKENLQVSLVLGLRLKQKRRE